MSSNSFHDFVPEQLTALDGQQNFQTDPDF
jgi:hypothetical protein